MIRTDRVKWVALAVSLLVSRVAHLKILWVEECYPAAAAIQMLHGKVLYRDFVFDKPPLAPLLYLLWGGYPGWPLRIAGTLFILLCCALAYRFALELWGAREGWFAAVLLAFFLTFGVPSAVLAMAPDLLMLAPHVAAVYLAWRGRSFAAGALAAVALLTHTKGVFVLAGCLLPQPKRSARVLGGFGLVCAGAAVVMIATRTLVPFWEQVWKWGLVYAGDTFVEAPWTNGLIRTGAWIGFHAALIVGAIRAQPKRWMLVWLGVSFLGVVAGLRFFPRYYFQLLPVMVLLGARGLSLLPRPALLLLLIPLVRFGPRYVALTADLVAHRETNWADVAMNQDSERSAEVSKGFAQPGDTLLVWGYRPDVWVYTRMAAGTPFLDSQPLTGVVADRHLVDPRPTAPKLAEENRRALKQMSPTTIIDGLGKYNPALSISNYPDLREWLSRYEVVGNTEGSSIYRRATARAPAP